VSDQEKGLKMIMKRIISLVIVCAVLMLCACGQKTPERPEESTSAADEVLPVLEDYPTQHETEFGGVYIEITIDDFNKLGFNYGDSVDVSFSNGYTLEDIPYYNGYYVDAGQPLLIAYPGYEYIKAAVNYGNDLWETAGLKASAGEEEKTGLWLTADLDEHSKATVRLRERGKYADIQAARDIHYEDIREKFPSDEVFANFRNVRMGDIGENVMYRSASPCDNQHKRAPYVDALIKEARVGCILNLSDNDAKIENYISKDDFDSPYFLSLYENGNVIPIALSMNYQADDFGAKIAQGFVEMTQHDGPYLIHCTEGKDRTGFVCMLIEALMGAGYQEIVDDYMITYDNYYRINEQSDKEKYDVILEKNLDAMIISVIGDADADPASADLKSAARNFLLKSGMTGDQIDDFCSEMAGSFQ